MRQAGAILSIIALIAVTEMFAIPRLLNLVPQDYVPWNRVHAKRAYLREQQSYDVLALGDSTGVQSLLPMRFAVLTGKTMYNYGTYGGTSSLTDIYFFLEYVRLHGAPEALITVRSPYFWYEEQSSFDMFYKQFPHLGLSWQFYRNGLMTFPQVMRMALYRIFPSFFYREQVAQMRELVTSAERRAENMLDHEEIPGEGGYEPFNLERHTVHPDMDEKNWSVLRQMLDENGKAVIHKDNLTLLKLLCRNASAYGVPLYVTTGPTSDVFRTDATVAPALSAIEDAIENTLEGETLCTYWRKDRTIAREYRSDPTHTLQSGSLLFTEMIAKDFLKSEKERAQGNR